MPRVRHLSSHPRVSAAPPDASARSRSSWGTASVDTSATPSSASRGIGLWALMVPALLLGCSQARGCARMAAIACVIPAVMMSASPRSAPGAHRSDGDADRSRGPRSSWPAPLVRRTAVPGVRAVAAARCWRWRSTAGRGGRDRGGAGDGDRSRLFPTPAEPYPDAGTRACAPAMSCSARPVNYEYSIRSRFLRATSSVSVRLPSLRRSGFSSPAYCCAACIRALAGGPVLQRRGDSWRRHAAGRGGAMDWNPRLKARLVARLALLPRDAGRR